MKEIFILFMLFHSSIAFAIDECKTDVYFANGILVKKETAIDHAGILEDAIKQTLGPETFTQTIGKVDYAYNETIGKIWDATETVLQKFGWVWFGGAIMGYIHSADVEAQVTAYKASISSGHKVLVVAHSQGNLFTREAYLELDSWMRDYFEAVSVASPMSADIKLGTPRIDWDNDFVPRIASLGTPTGYSNNVRDIEWESNNSFGVGKPEHYAYKSDLGKSITNQGYKYTAKEGGIDWEHNVHGFTFYMGENLRRKDSKDDILNPFNNKPLADTHAKSKIMEAVKSKQTLHSVANLPHIINKV